MVNLNRLIDSRRYQQEAVFTLVDKIVQDHSPYILNESDLFREIPVIMIRLIESNNATAKVRNFSFAILSLHTDLDQLNKDTLDYPCKAIAKKGIHELLDLLNQYSFLFKDNSHE